MSAMSTLDAQLRAASLQEMMTESNVYAAELESLVADLRRQVETLRATVECLTAETRLKDQAIAELTVGRCWLTQKGMTE